MRIVTWTIRLVLFLLLAAFAAKNIDSVPLKFYFGLELTAPLIVMLLGFFAAGALFGVLALLGALLRQRREISALKRQGGAAAQTVPPPPF
jgi:uncharacterized integral membrane protein